MLGAKKEQDAILEIVRLTGDEVEFRPVVLVGELSEVDGKQVTSAVGARQSGVYNSFKVTSAMVDQEFVVRYHLSLLMEAVTTM